MNIQNHPSEDIHMRAGQFLVEVEEALQGALELDLMGGAERPRVLQDAARHLCFSGGKRARPRLVYLFGEAVGAPSESLRDIALSAELIHTASLMHDDVIDDGMERRGRPTVNARWANTVAVLAGDLLLTLAFSKLKPYPKEILTEATNLVSKMTKASMMEVEAWGRLDLGKAYWDEIAQGKTGALFAWCGWAAARLVNDQDAQKRFSQCGYHLGVAFQIADDLKDLAAPGLLRGVPGKDHFADLRNGNPSFVLYDAMEHSPSLREEVLQAWKHLPLSHAQTQRLGQKVLETNTASRTLAALEREIEAAMDALGPYKDREGTAEIVDWIHTMFLSLCKEFEGHERLRQVR